MTLLDRLAGVLNRDEATALDHLLTSPAAQAEMARARTDRDAERDRIIAERLQVDRDEARDAVKPAAAVDAARKEQAAARERHMAAEAKLAAAMAEQRNVAVRAMSRRTALDRKLREDLLDQRIADYVDQLERATWQTRDFVARDVTRKGPKALDGGTLTGTVWSNRPAQLRRLDALVGAGNKSFELYLVKSADLDAEIRRRLAAIPPMPSGGDLELVLSGVDGGGEE